MPRFAANISLMFTELDFLDRFEAAASNGFKAVEFLFPYSHEPATIRDRLRCYGLELVLFNIFPGNWQAGERGLAALKGRETEFETAVAEALRYAEALGCQRLHAMAGLIIHGAERLTYVANLKRAASSAAAIGVDILIEPINSHDMPGYFLTQTADAADVITDVGHANVALQFDLYHRHKMEAGVEQAIDTYSPLARHYQCAGPPDRGEPDNREINYSSVFKQIDATGFKGWIGCEYRPRGTTVEGLNWPGLCDVSLNDF